MEHLTLIKSKFPVAWMLVNFYDKKRLLFLHYLDVFDHQLAVQHEDAEYLRRFVQTISSNLKVWYIICWKATLAIKTRLGTFISVIARYTDIWRAFYLIDSRRIKNVYGLRGSSGVAKASFITQQADICIVCGNDEHAIERTCNVIRDMCASERMAIVLKHRLCFKSLSPNHYAAACGS